MNTKKYLQQYKQEILSKTQRWSVQSKNYMNSEYNKQKLQASFKILDSDKIVFDSDEEKMEFESYVKGNRDYKALIGLLEKSLLQDIKDCTNNLYPDIFKSVALGIFPFGHSYAYCSDVTHKEEQLDGHVIGINEGLYISLELLAKAIVVENLQNDLEQYKHSGDESFMYALKMYLNPDPAMGEQILFKGLPAEIYGEISAYQSSVAMMILKFISLHEFGHAVNNDTKLMQIHRLFMTHTDTINQNYELFHNVEYEADLFAIKYLNTHTKSVQSVWSNFITIYLFFYWIHYVELYNEKWESTTHPRPLDRANKLHTYMCENYGYNQEAEDGLQWVREKTKEWYEVKFVKGENIE